MIVWVMQHCIQQNFRDYNTVSIARDQITGTSIETVSRYEQMNTREFVLLHETEYLTWVKGFHQNEIPWIYGAFALENVNTF